MIPRSVGDRDNDPEGAHLATVFVAMAGVLLLGCVAFPLGVAAFAASMMVIRRKGYRLCVAVTVLSGGVCVSLFATAVWIFVGAGGRVYAGPLIITGYALLLGLTVWLAAHELVKTSTRVRFAPRRVRRLKPCFTCGYSLVATTSGRCPECGTPVPPPEAWG